VYSGKIIISGGTVPAEATLLARIGGQEYSAFIDGESYRNLVVAPGDLSLVGQEIEFFLNGVASSATATYEGFSGGVELNLIFFSVPTPTPVPPTVTPVPPTATPVPPTATPVPPTATPVPPTETPAPPTPMPPTATPVPPTATPVPTETPVPPMATPEPTSIRVPIGGGCLATIDSPLAAGLGNLLLLVAPLGMIAGIRRFRRPAVRRR
jgi:hypothetical protein